MPKPPFVENAQLRWKATRLCVCSGLLIGMLFSWRLWVTSARSFPVLPCFGLGKLPAPFDWLLFLAALVLLLLAMFRLWDRLPVLGLLLALGLLGLLDQMRWQPWAYQYFLCLVPLALVWREDDEAGIAAALDLLRLIVVAIYMWSGIHKFGVQFQRTYQSDVVTQLLDSTSGWLNAAVVWSGNLVPWVELSIGICLVSPRLRMLGVWMAVGTHAFILLMLGPFGTSANSVIWPWNLAMAGMVLALFWRFESWALLRLFAVRRLAAATAVLAITVVVMPARSYQKHWPQYLSFHLYSGHHQRMALILERERAGQLGDFFQPILREIDQQPSHLELSFAAWSMADLNVPMPSEDRLLLRVAKELEQRFGLTAQDYFYRDYPELLAERGFDRYSPSEIRGMTRFRPFRHQLPAK